MGAVTEAGFLTDLGEEGKGVGREGYFFFLSSMDNPLAGDR